MPSRHPQTEILRLLSSFAVVLLHVAAQRMSALPVDGAWLPCLVNSLCRFAVPVFVMISGRYMLAKECSIQRGLKKAGKMLLAMLGWAAIYLLYDLTQGWRPGGVGEVVYRLLTEPVHLWYFYAAAALYLFTPVLAAFTCAASRQQLLYAITLTGFFGSIVTILLRTSHFALLGEMMDKSKIPMSMGFLCCYFLGYYLVRFPLEKRGRRLLILGGILGWTATFGGTMWLSQRAGNWNDLLLSFFAPNVIVTSTAVFDLINNCNTENFSTKTCGWLAVAGGTTGGIYGLHMLILWLLPLDELPMGLQALTAYGVSGLLVGSVLLVRQKLRRPLAESTKGTP